VLLTAATTSNGAADLAVRKYALMAMANLADDLPPQRLRDDNQAMQVLLRSAQDSEYQIQEAAAFALGVVGGERSVEELVKLLEPTTHPNPRYNAATGLARQGDARAVPVLVEMMHPSTAVGIEEEEKASRDIKLASVIANSLKATRLLVEKNPQAGRTMLIDAVKQLRGEDLSKWFVPRTGNHLMDEADATLTVLNTPP
jgi:HEAT repeat protein